MTAGHNHEPCKRCDYEHDLLAWFRVENMRLMRKWNGSEESRLSAQRAYNATKGTLYRAVAAMTSVIDEEFRDWKPLPFEDIEAAVDELFAALPRQSRRNSSSSGLQDGSAPK